MSVIRAAVAMLGFVLASLYAFGIALVRRDRSRVARDYGRMLARLIRGPLGLSVEVAGEENLRRVRPCVYVANHQSILDVPILGGIYPEGTVLVAKQELRKLPLFGWIYVATGNLLIDRSDNPSAVQRMKEAEAAIRTRGVSVWMFPEGTRGRTPGALLPFKKGAFYLAVAAGVPIVPVVVSPIGPIFDSRRLRLRPGAVQVRILEPVPTGGYSEDDVTPLIEEVRRRMEGALRELRTGVRGEIRPATG